MNRWSKFWIASNGSDGAVLALDTFVARIKLLCDFVPIPFFATEAFSNLAVPLFVRFLPAIEILLPSASPPAASLIFHLLRRDKLLRILSVSVSQGPLQYSFVAEQSMAVPHTG